MASENVIQKKSYSFALKIVALYQFLTEERKEYVLAKQLLRSGTSIGANVEEAIGAQSKRDFFAKMTISYKEARETKYWLRLLRDSKYIEVKRSENLIEDCNELLRIITAIQKSTKVHFN